MIVFIPIKYKDKIVVFKADYYDWLKYKKVGTWYASSRPHGFYLATKIYNKENKTYSNAYFHRFVMQPEKGMYVDHINRDILDNTKKNLRVLTSAESARNRGIKSNNKTGYIGVSLDKRNHKRWQVQFNIKGKPTYIGYFKCKHDAAEAYNSIAYKYYGDLAVLNKIVRD